MNLSKEEHEALNAALADAFARSKTDPGAAAVEYSRLLERYPFAAAPLDGLARIQSAKGAYNVAERLLKLALQVQPDYHAAFNDLAAIRARENRQDEAIELLQKAIALKPYEPHYCGNLVGLLRGRGRIDEAFTLTEAWIDLHPTEPRAWRALAECLIHLRRGGAAIAAALRLRALQPDALAYGLLSRAYEADAQYAQSLAEAQTAIALDPDHAVAVGALAQALAVCGRPQEAMQFFERLIALEPGTNHTKQASFTALLAGPSLDAWRAYESRFDNMPLTLPDLPNPRWNGEDVAGKRIVLVDEQGLGDNIQFARAAWEIVSRGGQALLHFNPNLAPLFTRLPPGIRFVPVLRSDEYDYWTPTLSAPLALRAPWAGPNAPYVFAPAGRRPPPALQTRSDALHIGLVWAGSAGHRQDHLRSAHLNAFAPLLGAGSARFYALQKGPPSAQIGELRISALIEDLGPHLQDWGDTAAAIDALDLVITVDTSVAHVAGAMGKPVWVLLQYAPDWRWGVSGATTPWYSSVRLYRQTIAQCWRAPIEAMLHDLAALAERRRRPAAAGLRRQQRIAQ